MPLIPKDEATHQIWTLAKQVEICTQNKNMHLNCVFIFNRIDCAHVEEQVLALLAQCYAEMMENGVRSQRLIDALNTLVACCDLLMQKDELAPPLLNALVKSSLKHKSMWDGIKSPVEVQSKFGQESSKEEKGNGEDVEAGSKSGDGVYLERVQKLIETFGEESGSEVQQLIDSRPVGFKFADEVFQKLIDLEYELLKMHDASNKATESFYNLFFFVYQHPTNPVDAGRKYELTNEKYTEQEKELRVLFSLMHREALNTKILPYVFENRITDETRHLARLCNTIFPSSLYAPLLVSQRNNETASSTNLLEDVKPASPTASVTTKEEPPKQDEPPTQKDKVLKDVAFNTAVFNPSPSFEHLYISRQGYEDEMPTTHSGYQVGFGAPSSPAANSFSGTFVSPSYRGGNLYNAFQGVPRRAGYGNREERGGYGNREGRGGYGNREARGGYGNREGRGGFGSPNQPQPRSDLRGRFPNAFKSFNDGAGGDASTRGRGFGRRGGQM